MPASYTMVENPYEEPRTSPYETSGLRARRGEGYQLPPIGDGRRYDQKHFSRQERIGALMMVLLVVVPLLYLLFLR